MRLTIKLSILILLALSGCGLHDAGPVSSPDTVVFVTVTPTPALKVADTIPMSVTAQPYVNPATNCAGAFVPHQLDHTTTVAGEVVRMFDSNGSGLAINDLDNDGDLDLVLANLKDTNTILWNEGQLTFRQESLPYGNSRAVAIIDVDGDGWQDIVFTQRTSPPLWWRNQRAAGLAEFSREPLAGVDAPAYSLAWGDLDQDGDLDVVTGSYDAELNQQLGDAFLFSDGAGVFVYENQNGQFAATRLAKEAQALTIALVDLDRDNRLDILVGNDFDLPDYAWRQSEAGWQTIQPFATTTHSTMSFDLGDLNNDGRPELFATDMKPYNSDGQTLAAWQPVFEMMSHGLTQDDPQVMENVLQMPTAAGHFENRAAVSGLAATGWSWSAKFGDLDQDGFLDIYVVNGMAAQDLFGHLPNHELVEENQAFRNEAGHQFVPAPAWHLNATQSGRGMSLADLDHDGDLDIVVNNLLAPAMLFENQLCQGASLAIDLFWPGSHNIRALGAKLSLQTSTGTYYREVKAGSGYLSGDPARLHFGFPTEATLQRLDVYWPDGASSTLDLPLAQTLLTIRR